MYSTALYVVKAGYKTQHGGRAKLSRPIDTATLSLSPHLKGKLTLFDDS